MQLPSTEARAFVFGPPELAELIAGQFRELGIITETVRTPATDEELYSWLTAHASDVSTFLHPGLSFWADRPEFPQIVSDQGFFPVTPSARSVALCLNKLNLLVEAEAAGIAHLAVGLDPLSSLREIEQVLENTGEGFPIVLKSLKVAQGHGIQVVSSLEELREIVPIWFEQLTRRYGEASVLIEKCLPSARHLIVPFAANGNRFLEIFPVIDASLQTRWRRMIQFAPAADLGDDAEAEIRESIRKWVDHLGFAGFGSMEFLVDGDRVYMIDAIARLNAGFPLWQELVGVRAVEWQLAALGQLPIPGRPAQAPKWGAGLSLRFYAEDPLRQVPCPGLVREITPNCRFGIGEDGSGPAGEAIWMTRYTEGQTIPWTSTGVIGELFVFGLDRKQAMVAAGEAIRRIWIAGSVQTNRRFLIELLEHPFVRENLIHAGFTDEDFVPRSAPDLLLVQEVVALADSLYADPGARWAVGGQWISADSTKIPKLGRLDGGSGTVIRDGKEVRFLFEANGADRWVVHYDTWTLSLRRVRTGVGAGAPSKEEKRIRKILALAPGRIHALLRQPGETLQPRDRACMLESIGILVPHAVPVSVKLLEWKVVPGQIVEAGHELAVFELIG